MDPQIAFNVCESPVSEAFELTPKKLYQQIKNIAEKRYNYTLLPKKLSQLKVLESSNNKISILRDICLSVGIIINFKGYQNEAIFVQLHL